MNAALAGRRILLTRPIGQAQAMRQRLEAQGAIADIFPAIRIVLQEPDAAALRHLQEADLAIFTSANAVRGLAPQWTALRQPAVPRIAAIGQATARALREHGLTVDLAAPPPYNSEALLALHALHTLQERRVAIVRGQGGRELLAAELRRRGAAVHYLEVYRREPPATMLSLQNLPHGLPELICITSAEIAANLLQCIAPQEQAALLDCPLLAGNERIAEACRNLDYAIIGGIASNPGDDAMMEAILQNFAATGSA